MPAEPRTRLVPGYLRGYGSGVELESAPDAEAGPLDGATPASWAQLDREEILAWTGFLRTHSSLVRLLDAGLVAEHRLPLTEYDVLAQLNRADQGQLRMSDLAQRVLLSPSGISRLVDRLVDEALVERRPCGTDGRTVYATITERGRSRLREAQATHLEGVRQLFLSRFTAAELRQLAGYWARFE